VGVISSSSMKLQKRCRLCEWANSYKALSEMFSWFLMTFFIYFSVTEMSVEPLKGQLKDLDQAITDQLVLIAAVKSNIMRNDDKISKMLGSVSKS
jgi:hypothetical protein